MLRCGQCLREGVVEPRELSKRIITAREKKHERQKLREIHVAQPNLPLAKEQQRADKQDPNQLDDWRRHARDTRRTQVSVLDTLGHLSESCLLTLFALICLDDSLIRQGFLRCIGQSLAALEGFAREFAQRTAKSQGQERQRWRNQQRSQRELPIKIKASCQESYERKSFAKKVAQRIGYRAFNGRGAGNQTRNEVVRAMVLKEPRALFQQMRVKILPQTQHRRLANARHQVSRKIFGDALGDGECNQENGDSAPGGQAGRWNQMLQPKEGRCSLGLASPECLTKNGDDQGSGSGLEQRHRHHCDCRNYEGTGVRQKVL